MTADIHTLTGAYAVDALPEDEARFFESHLEQCDACRQEVDELRATASLMGTAAHEPAPASLKSAVMAEIDTVRQEPPARTTAEPRRSRDGWYQRLLAPAAAVLVVAVLGLTAIIGQMNNRIATLEAGALRVADVVAASDAETVEVAGPEGSTARIVYSASRGEGVFLADGLPALSDEQVYELWMIGADGAVPAGLFHADDRGRVTHVMTGDLSQVAAIGVTVEPAGGSPQPTSDPIIVAEL